MKRALVIVAWIFAAATSITGGLIVGTAAGKAIAALIRLDVIEQLASQHPDGGPCPSP